MNIASGTCCKDRNSNVVSFYLSMVVVWPIFPEANLLTLVKPYDPYSRKRFSSQRKSVIATELSLSSDGGLFLSCRKKASEAGSGLASIVDTRCSVCGSQSGSDVQC